MISSFKTKTAVLATVGVLGLGGVAFAAASSDAPTPLTGSITDRIAKAALADHAGATLVGVESRADGSYEAELRQSDGSPLAVVLDKDFKVTDTREGGFGGHRGPGGPGGPGGIGDTAQIAKALGVTEEKLRSALEATGRADDRQKDDPTAAIAKALGVSKSDVAAVFDAQRDGSGRDGGRHGRGLRDRSALVTALAKKTGKSEDAVEQALDGLRTAREDARARALADKLGIDAAKVRAALEDAKPSGRP